MADKYPSDNFMKALLCHTFGVSLESSVARKERTWVMSDNTEVQAAALDAENTAAIEDEIEEEIEEVEEKTAE